MAGAACDGPVSALGDVASGGEWEVSDLTFRERVVLGYLDALMEAPAIVIGREVYARDRSGGSNLTAIGAAVCGRLRKRGFVTNIRDLGSWRITATGRAALRGQL
jgi:hypothetical protein